jgi:hypothetical protein
LIRAEVTVDGEAPWFVCRQSAIAPATCGVAIEVPLIVFVAVSPVFQDDVMLVAGGATSVLRRRSPPDEARA